MPFFDSDYFYEFPLSHNYGLTFVQIFKNQANDAKAIDKSYDMYLELEKNLKHPII